MPASRQRARSSASAFAVSATIGTCPRVASARSAARIAAVASNPSMTGMLQSISTTS